MGIISNIKDLQARKGRKQKYKCCGNVEEKVVLKSNSCLEKYNEIQTI